MKALLIALALTVSLFAACGGDSEDLVTPSARTDRAPETVASDTRTDSVQSQTTPVQPDKVVINSTIELRVDDLRMTYEAVGDEARRIGGFVAQAQIRDQERDASASVRVRVPAARHDELLRSLRSFPGASVQREETNSREVSAEFTDLQSRIRNLQRSEEQYQQIMGRAGSINEIISVNTRLDDVRGQVEQTQGRLNLLGNQADFATVNVALSTTPVAVRSDLPKPPEVFVDAFDASLTVALVVLNVLAVVLVAAIWLVPLGLAGLVLWRVFGQRLRTISARIASW